MSSSVSPLPLHKVAQSKQNRLPLNAEVRIVKGNHKGELGVLRYFGFVRFAWGTDPLKDKWVGVALHAPHGRHDGKVSGVRYFRCQAKHGVFVRGRASVEVVRLPEAPSSPASLSQSSSQSPSSPSSPPSSATSSHKAASGTPSSPPRPGALRRDTSLSPASPHRKVRPRLGRRRSSQEGTSLAPFTPPPLISPVSSPRVEPQVRAAALADSSDEEEDDEVLLVREHEGVRGRRSGRRDERDEGDDVQDGVGLRVDASTDAAPSAGASTLASRRGTLTISVDTSSLDARVGGGAPSPRSPRSPLSPSSPGSDISPVLERAHRRTQSMKEKFDRKAKRKRMRERIMGEIISTERRYVESMGLAVSKFYEPLRELAQAGKIDEEKVHTMFSNIEQLVAFHHLFLEQLSKEENHNVGGMATAFLRYSDYLRMYTIYVNNHEAAIRAYTSLVNSSKRFQSFLEKAGRDPELRGMQLASFLIMPVQRIPRYQLLLSSLAKHSEPDPVQNVPQAHRNAVSNPSSPVPQTQLATLRQQQSKHSSPERGKQPLTPSGTESDTGSGRTGSLKRRSLEQSLERSRRLSVQHADEISAGPLARLEMALAKIREIATFVNERKREEESIEFTVMKVNRLNSNTPRLFELDIKRKQLIIAKHSKNAGSEPFADRDLVLTPECFDRIKLSNKLREKITFWFFPPGSSRLLRKKKEWKLLFSDHGARQRFFHLTQVHFMTRRSQAGERGYTYEPQPLAVSNEMHLQVQELPVQALAEELHSVWVQEKQKQGFCFGPQVDNKLRTHPGLVAFDELHESERRRDVQAAEDLLASILALGFRIRKASQEEEERVGGPIERELWELVEYLAETAHDSWAEGKMRDGWTYGPERDDVNKKHPGLVAYCDLASVEQDFDRHAAENVLTTLIELGYVVEKRAVSAMPQNEAEG